MTQVAVRITYPIAEYLDSIALNTPFRTEEEIQVALELNEATKPVLEKLNKFRDELFDRFAILAPRGNAGKGGGKTKKSDMVHQIPEGKREEYHNTFLEFAKSEVDLVLEESTLEAVRGWVTASWLCERVTKYIDERGIQGSTQMKTFMQAKKALSESQPYVPSEEVTDDGAGQSEGEAVA